MFLRTGIVDQDRSFARARARVEDGRMFAIGSTERGGYRPRERSELSTMCRTDTDAGTPRDIKAVNVRMTTVRNMTIP